MTEFQTFERAAKALMRKIAKYVEDGGDVLTASATERGFYKSRDRLVYDQLRKLGLTEDVKALELALLVKQAVSAAPELARMRRQALNDRARAELKDKALERRDWEIANGLRDPPRFGR